MELNEHIVISFLLVVIVILIFSKLSISTGSLGDSSDSSDSSEPIETAKPTQNIPIMQATINTPFDPMSNSSLSDDFKKQLMALDNQFYTNVCRAK